MLEARGSLFVQVARMFPDRTERLRNEIEITAFLGREKTSSYAIKEQELSAYCKLERQVP